MPNFRFFALGLATLFIVYLIGVQATPAAVLAPSKFTSVKTYYNYYVITGNTQTELRAQMSQQGPSDRHSGQRFDANTDWNIRWSYRYHRAHGKCALRSTSSRVIITFTLPKWQKPLRPSRSLVADWQQYMAALQLHENGHRYHGLAANAAILDTLQKQPAYASCEELETAIKTTVEKVVQRYNREDIKYDQATQHGYTQGAVFPALSTAER